MTIAFRVLTDVQTCLLTEPLKLKALTESLKAVTWLQQ